MTPHRAVVIDIGSNSIKALVAMRNPQTQQLEFPFSDSREARISAGIGQAVPILSEEGIETGVRAVQTLLENCQPHGPFDTVKIVATSAVRSASNGQRFRDAVQAATGYGVDLLSGDEEAEAIAAGILGDPELAEFDTFTAFDLGGGSLELMHFQQRRLSRYESFELGSVRLMERFFANPSKPIPQDQQTRCVDHISTVLKAGSVALCAPLVGCGGGLTVAARLLELHPDRFTAPSPQAPTNFFPRTWFDSIRPEVVDASHAQRLQIQGIPESRADIFPVAILTCITLMDLCQTDGIHHTTHNLRFGIARTLLFP